MQRAFAKKHTPVTPGIYHVFHYFGYLIDLLSYFDIFQFIIVFSYHFKSLDKPRFFVEYLWDTPLIISCSPSFIYTMLSRNHKLIVLFAVACTVAIIFSFGILQSQEENVITRFVPMSSSVCPHIFPQVISDLF